MDSWEACLLHNLHIKSRQICIMGVEYKLMNDIYLYVAITKTESREREIESGKSRSHTGRLQTDRQRRSNIQLRREIGISPLNRNDI